MKLMIEVKNFNDPFGVVRRGYVDVIDEDNIDDEYINKLFHVDDEEYYEYKVIKK